MKKDDYFINNINKGLKLKEQIKKHEEELEALKQEQEKVKKELNALYGFNIDNVCSKFGAVKDMLCAYPDGLVKLELEDGGILLTRPTVIDTNKMYPRLKGLEAIVDGANSCNITYVDSDGNIELELKDGKFVHGKIEEVVPNMSCEGLIRRCRDIELQRDRNNKYMSCKEKKSFPECKKYCFIDDKERMCDESDFKKFLSDNLIKDLKNLQRIYGSYSEIVDYDKLFRNIIYNFDSLSKYDISLTHLITKLDDCKKNHDDLIGIDLDGDMVYLSAWYDYRADCIVFGDKLYTGLSIVQAAQKAEEMTAKAKSAIKKNTKASAKTKKKEK